VGPKLVNIESTRSSWDPKSRPNRRPTRIRTPRDPLRDPQPPPRAGNNQLAIVAKLPATRGAARALSYTG
jgi:hypothetical protein